MRRTRLSARVRRWARRSVRGFSDRRPLLSVVVPVFNVEGYLAECLESLLLQTYSELEIVIVDDGSTDGSTLICQQYAARDPRIKLVRQENAGLGAARNRGVAESRGTFLAFADSDDTVPADAYLRMMTVLLDSGSDFVVGAMSRQIGDRYVEPVWVRRVHSARRVGVTVEEVPDVLANIFAWNKIFRRSFWERAGLEFPTGVRYEDQFPMTKAYLEADKFDMVSVVVYCWRTRQEGTSITQGRVELRDLHDRLESKRMTGELVAGYDSELVRRSWFAKVFHYDMTSYYRAGLVAGEQYWTDLVAGVRELVAQMPEDVWTSVPAEFRLSALLVANDRRDDYGVLSRFLDHNERGFPVREIEGRRVLALPFLEEMGSTIPGHCFELHPVDTAYRGRLYGLWWENDSVVRVQGAAFLRHLGREEGASVIRLALVNRQSGSRVEVAATRWESERLNVWADRDWQDHSDAGFEARVDVASLAAAGAADGPAEWDLVVTVRVDDFEHSGPLQTRALHSSATDVPPVVHGRVVAHPQWAGKLGLSFVVSSAYATLASVDVRGDVLILDVDGDGMPVREVLLAGPDETRVRSVGRRTGRSRTRHEVRLEDIPGPNEWWELRAVLSSGAEVPFHALGEEVLLWQGRVSHGARECSIRRRLDGTVVLDGGPVAVVQDLSFGDEALVVRGDAPGLDKFALRLRGPRCSTPLVDIEVVDGQFAATIPTRFFAWGADLLFEDVYAVDMASASAGGRVLVPPAMRDALPVSAEMAWGAWYVEIDRHGGLLLNRRNSCSDDQNSAYAQRQLQQTVYQAARTGPRRPVVLFECFNGKSVGDSPGAIRDYLHEHDYPYELVWSVSDTAVRVPTGDRAVVRGSAEWYAALGGAAYVVSNNNFPPFYAKAEGQVHVQTWHGTPLKKIGHDIESIQFDNRTYMATMDAEAANWDYLISPSSYCSSIFPHAFAYSGPVLEVGYPRNDVLVRESARRLRDDVRQALGIEPDQRVLLYAPTWRDTVRAGGSYDKVLFLDTDHLTAQLDDVVVLVRGHANTAGRPSIDDHGPGRVVDVTLYPDVAQLYLAADLLVTDYSSVMFDFALTRKPILLLVPDLETYRDKTRGFYFPLEEEAPGPLLRSTEDVIGWLRAPRGGDYRKALEAFVEKFSPYDDGHATERVVKAVFGEHSY